MKKKRTCVTFLFLARTEAFLPVSNVPLAGTRRSFDCRANLGVCKRQQRCNEGENLKRYKYGSWNSLTATQQDQEEGVDGTRPIGREVGEGPLGPFYRRQIAQLEAQNQKLQQQLLSKNDERRSENRANDYVGPVLNSRAKQQMQVNGAVAGGETLQTGCTAAGTLLGLFIGGLIHQVYLGAIMGAVLGTSFFNQPSTPLGRYISMGGKLMVVLYFKYRSLWQGCKVKWKAWRPVNRLKNGIRSIDQMLSISSRIDSLNAEYEIGDEFNGLLHRIEDFFQMVFTLVAPVFVFMREAFRRALRLTNHKISKAYRSTMRDVALSRQGNANEPIRTGWFRDMVAVFIEPNRPCFLDRHCPPTPAYKPTNAVSSTTKDTYTPSEYIQTSTPDSVNHADDTSSGYTQAGSPDRVNHADEVNVSEKPSNMDTSTSSLYAQPDTMDTGTCTSSEYTQTGSPDGVNCDEEVDKFDTPGA